MEKLRWEEIRANNVKARTERNGVSMFLALVDDECHEWCLAATIDGEQPST